MRNWSFWDWVGYAAIAFAAALQAADAGLKQAPKLAAKMPSIIDPELAAFVPLALVLFGTIVLFVRHWRSSASETVHPAAHLNPAVSPIESSSQIVHDTVIAARQLPGATEDEYVEDRYGPADSQLYNDLVAFCLDRLVPACEAQLEIQHFVIDRVCQNNVIQKYRFVGLRCHYSVKDFFGSYNELYQGLCDTSGEIIKLDRLVICLSGVEKTYSRMCAITDELASSVGIDIGSDPEISPLWQDWRLKHNELVVGYETIKRDSRIPILFRPGRQSRWGGVIA